MGATISTTQWYFHGKKHFTKTGYERHIKSYKEPVQIDPAIGIDQEGADGVDMTGKVVIVTGANSGIGKEMTTYAAAKGASVYMFCRSQARAEAAQKEIVEKTNNKNVNIILCDVSEKSAVEKAVEELQKKESKVDCLVCNAGGLFNDRRENSEGMEVTFASHFLYGSYLLPLLLKPQLEKASSTDGGDSRVILVSSGGMLTTDFPGWEIATNASKEKYDGTFAYAYAKRGQVLLAERWSGAEGNSLFSSNVGVVSAHPGWSGTTGVDDAFGDNKKYLEPMRTPWQGAEGIAWLMHAPTSKLTPGAFYLDRKPTKKHIAGPFMTEGSYTKNKQGEVDEMMKKLKEATGM